MWQTVFVVTNGIALAAWAMLVVAPRKPFPLAYVLYGGVGLLCLCYAAMFVGLFAMVADPVRDPGLAPADLSNYSVAGLKDLFRSEGAIVLGWTHYLALDLFTGLWIARDADAKGFPRLVQAPFLVLTLLAGPLGLFVWLAVRERRARASGWRRKGKTGAG
ncbi:ABA4-like family protein [Tsuneonella sp. YG55]|uniref:ABA4-like family protein n=1 Tax=Tsuneonella litorea TaxID=2976475 RepID=A0A9X2W258_9SPHN|nr:ABA4-like family protein [Tsuneonella litorea]MCT2559628.1 ABA4-like family protein [Tsuneonella litorea]